MKEQQNQNDYEDSIRLHRFKKRTLILAIVLVILIFLVITIVSESTKSYTEQQVTKEVSHKLNTDGYYAAYDGNLLIYSMDGANCTDASGKQLWNITYQMQNPKADVCGEYVAIGDYNGNGLYIMNLDGKKAEIQTLLPIRDFAVSGNGYVAAFVENATTMALYVYSPAGETVAYFDITMEESGYPYNIAISENGRLVAVNFVYIGLNGTSGMYESKVAFYNFGSVGANYQDNNVGGYYYADELVGALEYFDDTKCFALSDSSLYYYEGTQIPELTEEIPLDRKVVSYYYSEDYLGLVYRNTSVGGYDLVIYTDSGKECATISLDMEYKDIVFDGSYVYVYNQNECRLYTTEGTEKYAGLFDRNTFLLVPSSKGKFLVLTKSYIESVTLK